MKRSITLYAMLAAAVLAAPAAMAGSDIVKCVGGDGRITLTDQPCAAGAATVRLEHDGQADRPAPAGEQAAQPVEAVQPVVQRRAAAVMQLPRFVWKRPDLRQPVAMTSDVATLREARRNLLLQDSRPRLAGLQ